MFNPPGSPLSSSATTTASTASVYRVTNRGGIVHGAIVRGGGTGGTGRIQRPAQRQARITDGRGDDDGNSGEPEAGGSATDAGVFPFRGVLHAGGAVEAAAVAVESAATTTTARPRNRDLPLDRHGTLLCSPPQPSQRQDGGALALDQASKQGGQGNNQDSAPPSPGRSPRVRPETTTSHHQRLSPPVAQVTVSWRRGPEREEGDTCDEEEVSPSMAELVPEVEVPSYTPGGREPCVFQGDHVAGYHDVTAAGFEGPRSGAYCGGGLGYEPLSKGPDYRKVCRRAEKGCSLYEGTVAVSRMQRIVPRNDSWVLRIYRVRNGSSTS